MITRQFTTAIKGAASAVSVSIGFKPRFVRVVNYDTAGSLEWQAGMPAASGVKVVTAGAQTVVTSNGITVSDEGQITIGTDATNAAPAVTTTFSGTKGEYKIVVASATSFAVGKMVYGTGIQEDSEIVAVSGTTITLSKPLTQDVAAGTACGICNLLITAF